MVQDILLLFFSLIKSILVNVALLIHSLRMFWEELCGLRSELDHCFSVRVGSAENLSFLADKLHVLTLDNSFSDHDIEGL